jgi:hypothetical protein
MCELSVGYLCFVLRGGLPSSRQVRFCSFHATQGKTSKCLSCDGSLRDRELQRTIMAQLAAPDAREWCIEGTWIGRPWMGPRKSPGAICASQ